MASSQGLDSELESFRQQWLSEVRTRQGPRLAAAPNPSSAEAVPPRQAKARPLSPGNTRKSVLTVDDEQRVPTQPAPFDDSSTKPPDATVDGSVRALPGREPVSALDHYEEAVAKEAEGNMGESLKLYRRAYRLDDRVDRRYREKHFPPAHKPQPHGPAQPPDASSAAPSAPSAQPASHDAISDHPSSAAAALPVKDVMAGFSSLQIQPAPAEVEGTPPAPCPISSLPRELLVHILHEVALDDVADFVRLSLVCKPLAYIVSTEQATWRAVCLGTRFGFTGMHRHWHKTTDWTDVPPEEEEEDAESWRDGGTPPTSRELLLARRQHDSIAASKALVPTRYASWRHMFRSRPRIRFNGCYISTVNYIRMGQASDTNQATWGGSPIHIVTYYRYLRFFRDGTAISLLTTAEPSAVVAHLTREALDPHRDSNNAHAHAHAHASPPSAVMQKAYRGRWRLSRAWDPAAPSGVSPSEHPPRQEADLTVETGSHDPKYMFRMDLSLRTAGKAAANNKVAWRAHASYNRLTDDWAPFTLKHDKAFFFSRVRSYGVGE